MHDWIYQLEAQFEYYIILSKTDWNHARYIITTQMPRSPRLLCVFRCISIRINQVRNVAIALHNINGHTFDRLR